MASVHRALSAGLVERYAEERKRWVRSAAAIRYQVIEALLNRQALDVESAGRHLGYELDRNHLGFVVWSENQHDEPSDALAMLDRAALALVTTLDTGKPLLVPRAHMLVAGWVGTRQVSDAQVTRPLRLDGEAFPTVLAGFGSLARGVEGFARTHEEAFHARRVAG